MVLKLSVEYNSADEELLLMSLSCNERLVKFSRLKEYFRPKTLFSEEFFSLTVQ